MAATASTRTASEMLRRRTPGRCSLAHVAGVAERIAARLRPDAQTVRPCADRDARKQPSGSGRDRIHLAVVAAGEPEHPAVRGDAAHVRAAPTWKAPLRDHLPRLEADYGDGAFPP